MGKNNILDQLLEFLGNSPTQFHATRNVVQQLVNAGYTELLEGESWKLKKGGKYYVVRNQSAVIAWQMGKRTDDPAGFRIIGAHTDSPGLQIKAIPENVSHSYLSLGVEVYGGPILPTWFDRDLSIAGRLVYSTSSQALRSTFIDFEKPVAVVPSLAVHLSKKADEIPKLNIQKEMIPIVMQGEKELEKGVFQKILLDQMSAKDRKECEEIFSFDLFLYDTQKPNRLGLNEEFVTGGRLDNLVSCFCGLKALLDTPKGAGSMLVLNDHEEIGSQSRNGANGNFLYAVLDRISADKEAFYRNQANSILLSVDNAHGIHPNYVEKHDPNHTPLLNRGPAVKLNAKHRYSTNGETEALFKFLCTRAKIPHQTFVSHSNIACGSTIGAMTSAKLGLKAMDIGIPTFAMHSIRETCGAADIGYLYKLSKTFLEHR